MIDAVVARRGWHVLLALAFLSAYLTGDVATFGGAHVASGIMVLAVLVIRLGGEALVSASSEWSLRRQRRRRWLGWGTLLVLAMAAAASATGLWAEIDPAAGPLHSWTSELALAVVGAHMGVMLLLFAA